MSLYTFKVAFILQDIDGSFDVWLKNVFLIV